MFFVCFCNLRNHIVTTIISLGSMPSVSYFVHEQRILLAGLAFGHRHRFQSESVVAGVVCTQIFRQNL